MDSPPVPSPWVMSSQRDVALLPLNEASHVAYRYQPAGPSQILMWCPQPPHQKKMFIGLKSYEYSHVMHSQASPPMATNPGMTQWNTAPRYVRRFPLWPRPGQLKNQRKTSWSEAKCFQWNISMCPNLASVYIYIYIISLSLSLFACGLYVVYQYICTVIPSTIATILGLFWPLHNSTRFWWSLPHQAPRPPARRPAPLPLSPVQRQRKFSQVSGTTSPHPPVLATQQRNFKDHHAYYSDVPCWYSRDANGTTLGRSKNHCFATVGLPSFKNSNLIFRMKLWHLQV